MRKKNAKTLGLVMTLIFSILFSSKLVFAEEVNMAQKIVLIDPGHGGMDGGAVALDKTAEKGINLAISLELKEMLENKGYKVEMTRNSDEGLYESGKTVREKKREDLGNRVKKKTETNCDIFVSIHQNIFPQHKYKGAQVWYSSNDLSKSLAESIQESFKTNIDNNNNRVAKSAGDQFIILKDGYKGASVIVECGFLSNNEELALLKTPEYQKIVADAIAKGVEKYFWLNLPSNESMPENDSTT